MDVFGNAMINAFEEVEQLFCASLPEEHQVTWIKCNAGTSKIHSTQRLCRRLFSLENKVLMKKKKNEGTGKKTIRD